MWDDGCGIGRWTLASGGVACQDRGNPVRRWGNGEGRVHAMVSHEPCDFETLLRSSSCWAESMDPKEDSRRSSPSGPGVEAESQTQGQGGRVEGADRLDCVQILYPSNRRQEIWLVVSIRLDSLPL